MSLTQSLIMTALRHDQDSSSRDPRLYPFAKPDRIDMSTVQISAVGLATWLPADSPRAHRPPVPPRVTMVAVKISAPPPPPVAEQVEAPFRSVVATIYFHMHPRFIGNRTAGIHQGLSKLVMKYVPCCLERLVGVDNSRVRVPALWSMYALTTSGRVSCGSRGVRVL